MGCDRKIPTPIPIRVYFNPRTPGGVRRVGNYNAIGYTIISIHAPRVGCDFPALRAGYTYPNFNPRTPGGVRLLLQLRFRRHPPFQSTHPGWGATMIYCIPAGIPANFNPRTPGGVRPSITISSRDSPRISIHAPRVGCDLCPNIEKQKALISIHAPRVGCDVGIVSRMVSLYPFQSTHPGWGATRLHRLYNMRGLLFQSTHPGWGATRSTVKAPRCKLISIHAPRVGCDIAGMRRPSLLFPFQSTHPGWGATI